MRVTRTLRLRAERLRTTNWRVTSITRGMSAPDCNAEVTKPEGAPFRHCAPLCDLLPLAACLRAGGPMRVGRAFRLEARAQGGEVPTGQQRPVERPS